MGESEFDNIVARKDKVQDMSFTQLKLEVYDIYKKEEKLTTCFEHSNDKDVVNKGFSDKNLNEKKIWLVIVFKVFRKRLQRI